MKRVRVYFEGDNSLRSGFQEFFRSVRDRARSYGSDVMFIALHAKITKFESLARRNPDDTCLLLKDSEGPAGAGLPRDHFEMVQLMEAWFLADPEAVQSWYGEGFRRWRVRPDVEAVPSADVKEQLRAATRDTKKGQYHKTRHAPALLAAIDQREGLQVRGPLPPLL